ncbi:hypothetical protein ACFQZ4_39210 [Catellatospora coxensis]
MPQGEPPLRDGPAGRVRVFAEPARRRGQPQRVLAQAQQGDRLLPGGPAARRMIGSAGPVPVYQARSAAAAADSGWSGVDAAPRRSRSARSAAGWSSATVCRSQRSNCAGSSSSSRFARSSAAGSGAPG